MVAIAVLLSCALGVATPRATIPVIEKGDVIAEVVTPDEAWGTGKKWWHCALSIAFAGLAGGFAGPAAAQNLMAAAVVGCLS